MINTILAIIWCLIKIAFIAVVAILAIVFIIAVLHPIVIDGKIRTTQRGQKLFINLSYLFNMLGVEFEASPTANRTYFRFLWKRKLIDKQDRVKEKKSVLSDNIKTEESILQTEQEVKSVQDNKDETNINNDVEIERVEENFPSLHETQSEDEQNKEEKVQGQEIEVKNEDVANSSEQKVSDNSESQVVEKEIEIKEEKKQVENEVVVEKTDETIPDKVSNDQTKEHVKIDLPKDIPTKEEGFFERIRRLLKKFKRDVNRRLDQLKGKIRLFRRHWRICKPAAKRLWKRVKAFVELKNIKLLVRYALPKPHLTGMLYGAAAGFFDLFRRLGIEFSLIPVFTGAPQTFYLKSSGRIVLRPFWILWALFCLLFEFSLYKEYYLLYKFIKSRKGKK